METKGEQVSIPISIEKLLDGNTVENSHLEFKDGWENAHISQGQELVLVPLHVISSEGGEAAAVEKSIF